MRVQAEKCLRRLAKTGHPVNGDALRSATTVQHFRHSQKLELNR